MLRWLGGTDILGKPFATSCSSVCLLLCDVRTQPLQKFEDDHAAQAPGHLMMSRQQEGGESGNGWSNVRRVATGGSGEDTSCTSSFHALGHWAKGYSLLDFNLFTQVAIRRLSLPYRTGASASTALHGCRQGHLDRRPTLLCAWRTQASC